jgi:N-acetylglucosaminyldiphosphoundecaprenol N-acetyl-beta-D-mannosaminyltransferase
MSNRAPADMLPTLRFVGTIGVHPVRLPELLTVMETAIADRRPVTVLYANVHAVNLARFDTAFRAAFAAADVVFCDGYGLRLGASMLGRPLPERFTPPDWIDPLAAACAECDAGVFLLGGRPGVTDEAARRLRLRHPGLRTVVHHGYFLGSLADERCVLDAVQASGASLLLVGLGMPLQERWVTSRRDELGPVVVLTVGALFDYIAGVVPRGPRWLTDRGLEWACRLWFEPRRLWRRYLLGGPTFLWLIVRQLVTERRALARGAKPAGDGRGLRWRARPPPR